MGRIGAGEIFHSTARLVLAALIMSLVMYFMHRNFVHMIPGSGLDSQIGALAAISITGAMVYLAVLVLLRAPEISIAVSIIKRKVTPQPEVDVGNLDE